MPVSIRANLRAALVGVGAGLLLFAVESALIARSGLEFLAFDTGGAMQQATAAARPQLTGLLARVALAYALCGALLALCTATLARDVTRTPRAFRLVWALDALAACALAAWAAAIIRPGLFEDVPALRPLLSTIVRHGHLWEPAVCTALFFALHLPRSLSRRRTALRGAFATCVALLPNALPPAERAPVKVAPLFVLIGVDAFRPDRIEGDRHLAPHIERFLRDAVRFDNAWTPIAQTEPAWAALNTASWPYRNGVRHPLTADRDRAPLPTFARAFAEAGYHTTFATDCSRFNWQGPESGFEERLQPPRGALNFVLEKLRYRGLGVFATNSLGAMLVPEMIGNRALAGFYDPQRYAARLADRLGAEARRGPLLFAYHDTTTHYPGDMVYPYYLEHPDAPLRMSYSPAQPPPGQNREALYDALLATADAQVGTLLQRLKDEGLYDAAWIVIFSDHGEGFHRDWTQLSGMLPVHGAQLSDDENRILLAIKPPAGSAISVGRTVHDLVRLIDLGPTLLDAGGLPSLAGADGVSLVPLLRGESMPPLRLYAETGYTHIPPGAIDAAHASSSRGFDSYRIVEEGVVEMTADAHARALEEKDIGAFDGDGWLVQHRLKDGTVRETCSGRCSASLRAWVAAPSHGG